MVLARAPKIAVLAELSERSGWSRVAG